jgi:hypothetical protein
MFLGGRLYPDVVSATFAEDEVDCAKVGTHVAQTSSVPTTKQFKALRTGIVISAFCDKTVECNVPGLYDELVWDDRLVDRLCQIWRQILRG